GYAGPVLSGPVSGPVNAPAKPVAGVASGWKPAGPERVRAETACRLCAKHDSRPDARCNGF
ncbi:hypothetical protein, partial [Pantoea agglomerans]|uniref:hypothetical protein n=1 Tax=Enterobacter agglomerans TaxID=549 RepID=UPI003208F223